MQLDIHHLLKKYQSAADFISFTLVHEKTRDLKVRNGTPADLNQFDDVGLRIELMVNGHMGYAGTCELTSEGIDHAIEQAKIATRAAANHAIFNFDPLKIRPKNLGSYQSQRQKKLDQISTAEIYDFLKYTSLKMKSEPLVITSNADCIVIECQHAYVNSNGAQINQDFNLVGLSFSATAEKSGETQNRTFHGNRAKCLQIGAEIFDLNQYLEICHGIAQEAVELLSAENCPNENCDLIIAPDQMYMQIHESIGHPLELDRILGDERNFAGWSFVQPEDFGKLQYGSPHLNVVFDPNVEHEFASYSYDETGNPAERKYLIRNGLLMNGLGGLESQIRSGLPGVANSRASSWNRPPIDRMANINLLGGDLSLDEMISKIERGVLMRANRSWSIDDYRRKFQFGCEYGKRIENGRLTKTLKNPNYRGITVPFWNNLAGLTGTNSIDIHGSPYCGKGEPSQVIRVGHASPYAWFKHVDVFGA